MNIQLPELSLVILVGASSSGKSTFAKKHFLPTEIISSDYCRALVSDDENSMEATKDAFELLHYMVGKRLKRGKLTVIDATNIQADARKPLLVLAKQYHCIPVVIALNLPIRLLKDRHALRNDRDFAEYVLVNHQKSLKRSLKSFKREGIRKAYVLNSPEEIEETTIVREPLWNNKKHEPGPFDIIGDIHGCFEELVTLLEKLGYRIEKNDKNYQVQAPEGRKAIFLGDLVDRGPNSPEVLRLVMSMVKSGLALCVPGNHDVKLLRKLNGKNVNLNHGLAETMEQLASEPEAFIQEIREFIHALVSHYVLDSGNLVVAHAGLREELQGRGSGAVRSFCMYGETTGEIDEFGLPVRYNWAREYKGKAMVVYGHTPVPEAEWLNNTIDIDTGCVFGGELTALRYPEKELVSVEAQKIYCEPVKPLQTPELSATAQQAYDDVLDIEDVSGKRIVYTRLGKSITLKEENSIAALEVMSRFGVHPKWMIYLPPTMSPTETSVLPDLLEHPSEGFQYYVKQGVQKVICEEKHMGSRAVVIVCKEKEVAQRRFGLKHASWGVCYTRTGRSFFNDNTLEMQFLERVHQALSATGFWEEQETDWVCLDCELMPWSAKAKDLILKQYAAVGASGTYALQESITLLEQAQNRGLEVDELARSFENKYETIDLYTQAYRRYCHEVKGLEGLKLAPFHILATEGKVHTDKDHEWHMQTIARFCKGDEQLLMATPYKVVDLHQETSVQEATQWWEDLTRKGGEGMVIKPYQFVATTERGLVQPAVKCRGKEYLRIIYGPGYSEPQQMKRLKHRNLSRKRSLALREFSLGVEALERFVKKEPLRKTHECVFGVLALESEEVDPRL
ncbi:polynucleotide kinase-phosphatase [Rapidithrix thailandica]|uniref:Polynucleotide kinase-phosphatase n=1 Tax=Rapidithrix thailandica TaxID=413964 RepID=A0AAW9S7W0_9BACT